MLLYQWVQYQGRRAECNEKIRRLITFKFILWKTEKAEASSQQVRANIHYKFHFLPSTNSHSNQSVATKRKGMKRVSCPTYTKYMEGRCVMQNLKRRSCSTLKTIHTKFPELIKYCHYCCYYGYLQGLNFHCLLVFHDKQNIYWKTEIFFFPEYWGCWAV